MISYNVLVVLGTYEGSEKVIDLRGLTLNTSAKEVAVNGEPVKLTPIEYNDECGTSLFHQ
ncbi:DNA-binding response regulator [Effusibacillus lacus]|uniref:DNA-binding response regulator n=1 Tax=Effusibacillus lacus TaxID=1348429 RepID=A0A292YPR3_9BACL|nr:DNA-binding response regulator [Effusibacillus lacus]